MSSIMMRDVDELMGDSDTIWVCRFCQEQFRHERMLDLHVKTEHPEMIE